MRLAVAARAQGFRSCMFCPSGTLVDYFSSAGFAAGRYQQIQPSYRRPAEYWRNSLALAAEFRRQGVSLLHSADVGGAYYTSLAALLARLPMICQVRNRADVMSKRDQSFLWPVSKFIFVSEHTRKTFAVRVKGNRGSVLYDGVDPRPELPDVSRCEMQARIRTEFGVPADRKIVGMVARMAPQKDYATLARAAKIVLSDCNACFLIVGDYKDPAHRAVYEDTQSMLVGLGISDRFIFTGFRPDVPELIAAMDVFVLSTHHEGFPLVLLEAMADARPVAATSVDGVPEVVLHEKTGLLHDHQNHEALAMNIRRLLTDECLAARLALAGKDLIRASFSRSRYEENVGAMYRHLIPR